MPDRAVVAISDDRQWLVVKAYNHWRIYQRIDFADTFLPWGDMPGEGMTAEEVLEAHLELQP